MPTVTIEHGNKKVTFEIGSKDDLARTSALHAATTLMRMVAWKTAKNESLERWTDLSHTDFLNAVKLGVVKVEAA